jgi:pyruvate ferredoxin oxidoreductase alpha subunit
MVVSARALAAPLNIHGDHSDVMGCRDAGWVQIFCENPQEVYDKTIIGLKLAEAIKFPVMVIMDGFNTSHSVENMEDLDADVVKKFVGEYEPEQYLLDMENPITVGPVALQNSYFEFRKDMYDDFSNVEGQYRKICQEYAQISGREYGVFEKYKVDDADKILVAMGSVCGTIKDAIDKLESEGEKVGLLELSLFRPFPYEETKKALNKEKEVIVMDRNLALGGRQVLASEIYFATQKPVKSKIYGLGGRDTFQKQIIDMVQGKYKGDFLK